MADQKQEFPGRNQTLGAVEAYQPLASGLVAQCTRGKLQLDFVDPSIIRVRAWKGEEQWNDFSYAVIAKPTTQPFHLQESKDEIQVELPKGKLTINKGHAALSVFNQEGELLCADDSHFSISWLGTEVTCYKQLQPAERFIGLGEKNGPLDKRGRSYVNWNTDAFAYGPDTDPLYLTAPFYIGIHEGRCYGIFFDNSHKTTFNFGASTNRFAWFAAENGQMNYYFIFGETPAEIIQAYSRLTGTMPMPPKWSLGFQQCRYSYYPEAEVLRIASTFREKQIPADVIYLDIHYMDAYKVFSWHPDRFPDPKGLVEKLKEMGFKLVVIMDPGLKVEEGYDAYDECRALDGYVKYPDGKPYEGQVWPGWSIFPDFTASKVRNWWAEKMKSYCDLGIEGFWNDMNEPAAWGQHLPNLIEFDFDGQGASHKEARNVYGMNMARATRQGAEQHLLEKRPFVLTRAGYAGIQRHAAVWTGDNVASDEHMLAGIRLINNLGLAGIPFAGYDVGGFVAEPSSALFARWMALAAFAPFFRAHSMINTRDAEPWSFGEEVEDVARNYIGLRYRLMPYIYDAFFEASQTGIPVARSLALTEHSDAKVFQQEFDAEFMFGPSILVAPVASNKDLAKVYLPKGQWFGWYDDQVLEGGKEHIAELDVNTIPLFVRAGACIWMQTVIQHTDQKTTEPEELHVYTGTDSFRFQHFEDDGRSKNAESTVREIIHSARERKIIFGKATGSYANACKRLQVVLHGLKNGAEFVLNGKKYQGHQKSFRLVEPISQFDPFLPEQAEARELHGLPCITIDLGQHETVLQY